MSVAGSSERMVHGWHEEVRHDPRYLFYQRYSGSSQLVIFSFFGEFDHIDQHDGSRGSSYH